MRDERRQERLQPRIFSSEPEKRETATQSTKQTAAKKHRADYNKSNDNSQQAFTNKQPAINFPASISHFYHNQTPQNNNAPLARKGLPGGTLSSGNQP
ncbi:MAG: hypothetical protein HGA70_01035 [Chlorobiaceae bacterium]|nr:hypothetical protein [Chlorobiaceae bacterium]